MENQTPNLSEQTAPPSPLSSRRRKDEPKSTRKIGHFFTYAVFLIHESGSSSAAVPRSRDEAIDAAKRIFANGGKYPTLRAVRVRPVDYAWGVVPDGNGPKAHLPVFELTRAAVSK